jgi:hypothetical protein
MQRIATTINIIGISACYYGYYRVWKLIDIGSDKIIIKLDNLDILTNKINELNDELRKERKQ